MVAVWAWGVRSTRGRSRSPTARGSRARRSGGSSRTTPGWASSGTSTPGTTSRSPSPRTRACGSRWRRATPDERVRGRRPGAGAPGPRPGEPESFQEMWRGLAPLGLDRGSGGYRRYAWSGADAECREWFRAQAESRGLVHEVDRNGNQWAWHGDPLAGDAVVTGSHLDSVPDGGAFDGPLGVVSSFAALDELRRRGAEFARPFAVVNFGDEEGARFGLACVGSRLTAGQLAVADAHRLRDADGTTLPAAMEAAGYDPGTIGPDPERLARIGAFVELHVEQGRALDLTGDP